MSKTFISAIGLQDGKDTINCFREGLTSLEGCPKIVEGGFNCSNNKMVKNYTLMNVRFLLLKCIVCVKL